MSRSSQFRPFQVHFDCKGPISRVFFFGGGVADQKIAIKLRGEKIIKAGGSTTRTRTNKSRKVGLKWK